MFTSVSLNKDVNLIFLLLLSKVAIIIESDLDCSSKVLASVPINNTFVIPGTSLYSLFFITSELLYILFFTYIYPPNRSIIIAIKTDIVDTTTFFLFDHFFLLILLFLLTDLFSLIC